MNTPRPRIAIFGTGSIGGYLGGRLHPHAQVRLMGRPRVIDALRTHGLRVSDLHGVEQYIAAGQLDLHTDLAALAPVDVVLVTVKSAATAQAARELAGVLDSHVPVISFQNGLHNADVLRAALPHHTVLAGMVPFNVVQLAPGVFHQGSGGELMVQEHPALMPLLPAFHAAGLALRTRADMPAVQAAKLLLNLNNAINALSGLPLRDELSQRGWRRCLALAQREALAVYRAAGMHPAQLTPLPPAWLPRVLSLPDALFQRLAARMLAIDPLARSSMWEDLQAGRPTEVDAINGEIVQLAARHSMRSPVNETLVALLREAERVRRDWQAEALLRVLSERSRSR